MLRCAKVLAAAAILALATAVHAEDFSDPAVNPYWAQSYTDGSGNYQSPVSNTTVSGGVLSAPLPTDAVQSSPDNDVVNYVRTRADLPGASTFYSGTLLGNLSSKISVSATFNIFNDSLRLGQQFQASQFVGEAISPNGPTPGLRLVFTGTGNVNADGAGDTEPNMWWSNLVYADVLTMTNGDDVTLTVNFDPSQWSNIDGKQGTDPLVAGQFQSALSDVSMLGLSFGSGYFFSDGFAFNTGGTASVNLVCINTTGGAAPADTTPVPLPSAAGMGLITLAGIGAAGWTRRKLCRA